MNFFCDFLVEKSFGKSQVEIKCLWTPLKKFKSEFNFENLLEMKVLKISSKGSLWNIFVKSIFKKPFFIELNSSTRLAGRYRVGRRQPDKLKPKNKSKKKSEFTRVFFQASSEVLIVGSNFFLKKCDFLESCAHFAKKPPF